MRELIYYPGFEVNSQDWLKFALLYIGTLSPIIPYSGDKELTSLYQLISNETDFLDVHRPEYLEGKRASLDCLDVLEKIMLHPERYFPIFLKSNVVEYWKNPESHDYTLFREKYSNDWESLCIKEKLATPSAEGLLMPKELCFIYMSILAQAIADGRGVSPITDYTNLDRFSVITRQTDSRLAKKTKIARSVINLKIPKNISQIEFKEIIKLRNSNGFLSRQQAFHIELDQFLSTAEEGNISDEFIKSFRYVWSSFTGEIVTLGTGAASLALAVWVLAGAPTTTPEMLVDILGGASVFGTVTSIRDTWKNTKSKRYCRKYLADLGNIASHIPSGTETPGQRP